MGLFDYCMKETDEIIDKYLHNVFYLINSFDFLKVYDTRFTDVWLSVNTSDLSSSVVRVLGWYAKGPGLESWLKLDFSPPVVLGFQSEKLHIFPYRNVLHTIP